MDIDKWEFVYNEFCVIFLIYCLIEVFILLYKDYFLKE